MAIKHRIKTYTCQVCKAKYEKSTADGFRKWCSPECGWVLANKKIQQKERRERAKERKRIKAEKEKLKTVTQLANDLKRHIQWIARQIDKDRPCICTGQHHEHYDGGHFWAAGNYRSVQFHLDNIHKQSVYTNQYLGGDLERYREGLKNRYGEEYLNKVLSLPERYKDLKFDRLDLVKWIEKAQEIRNQIKKGTPYTRAAVNKALGIYK